MPNTCWDCKHNSLKLKVLVPYNHTIKEYMHCTGNFQSDIVAVVKEKQGQYTVWFRSEEDIKLMSFEMLHTCALRIERPEKQVDCPCYRQNGEKKQISNIIYSKQPLPIQLAHWSINRLDSFSFFPIIEEQIFYPPHKKWVRSVEASVIHLSIMRSQAEQRLFFADGNDCGYFG